MNCRRIGVALKWVALAREEPQMLDARYSGLSAADEAALETAISIAAIWGCPVRAASAGPEAARGALVQALAVGAAEVVHVEAPYNLASPAVAALLKPEFTDCDVVVCGDYSLDRGSGSTPAFLAAELKAAQALDLSAVVAEAAGTVLVDRRLEAGRRERLRLRGRMVLSVGSSLARLRRGTLPALMAARAAQIPSRVWQGRAIAPQPLSEEPFRPRAKILPGPSGSVRDRLGNLTGLSRPAVARQVVELSPAAAADRIVGQLREWGYLEAAP
jgi:electron transfer flavoprotein beta subunit